MMLTEVLATIQNIKGYQKFHGYKITRCGKIYSKNGKQMKLQLRERRGGKQDWVIMLMINKESVKFTVSRLMAACFIGPVYGLEVNHKDRDPLNIHIDNLEIGTRSQNQKHWRREDEKLGK